MNRFLILILLSLCVANRSYAQDTAVFDDGTKIRYSLLENKADETDPISITFSGSYSDIHSTAGLTLGYYARRIGIGEIFGNYCFNTFGKPVNRIGLQTWVFVFTKRVKRKNSITVGRRGISVTRDEAVYKDYMVTVDAEKNRTLCLHIGFANKKYLTHDSYYNGYQVENVSSDELACGISFIANSHQKWTMPELGKETRSETSLYRLTFDVLYFTSFSVTLETNVNGIRPPAPEGLAEQLMKKSVGFRFLAEGNIPFRGPRLDYGLLFQAGVVTTPFDSQFEKEVFPIVSAGLCIRPDFGL